MPREADDGLIRGTVACPRRGSGFAAGREDRASRDRHGGSRDLHDPTMARDLAVDSAGCGQGQTSGESRQHLTSRAGVVVGRATRRVANLGREI